MRDIDRLVDATAELAKARAENKRLLSLLDYGTDTDAYRKLRAENERLRAALQKIMEDKSVLPQYEIARMALEKK